MATRRTARREARAAPLATSALLAAGFSPGVLLVCISLGYTGLDEMHGARVATCIWCPSLGAPRRWTDFDAPTRCCPAAPPFGFPMFRAVRERRCLSATHAPVAAQCCRRPGDRKSTR